MVNIQRDSFFRQMSFSKSGISQQLSDDQLVWKIVKNLLPVRRLNCSISKHTIVDEKNPFVLFAVELESEFSRYVAKKQFQNFVNLQKKLLSLRN